MMMTMMMMNTTQVSYKQQAEFSFAYWPFSVKLLWAPIGLLRPSQKAKLSVLHLTNFLFFAVDSLYVASFGRRKTWLVPVQYLIGVTMFVLSVKVDSSLEFLSQHLSLVKVEDYLGEHPDVTTLTAMFFFLNFLAATQDIAVDGWALTMLQVVGQSSILSLLSHLLRGTMLAMPRPAIQ